MATKKLMLINGNIITLSERKKSAESILVKDGKIVQIDPHLQEGYILTDTKETIDLNGMTVVPGLSDCHVHFTHLGLGLIFPDFRKTTSIEDLLDSLTDSIKDHPKGELFLGWNYDENLLREKRLPTIDELDKVSRKTPIWINRVGMNASLFNTKAFETINIPFILKQISPRPKENVLVSIPRVAGDANWIALARVLNSLTDDVRMKAYYAAATHCATKGITSVHAVEGCFSPNMPDRPDFACLEVPCLARNKEKIELDVAIWYQHIMNIENDINIMKSYGLSRMGGDIFADGVLGAALSKGVLRAALFDPYFDDPSTRGDLTFNDCEIEELVSLAWQAGFQFSAHAVGDHAFAQMMTAYQKAFEKKPGDGRCRVEHGILPDRSRLKQAAALGIIFSMQPAFDYYSGGPEGRYAERLGPDRAQWTNPFQDIMSAGCRIVGGSDAPTNTIDPILGIHSMVNHHYPEQRTSCLDALKAFTINPAYSIFEEKKKGNIEVGKQADLTVLSNNPLTINKSKIKDIQVAMTIYKGKVTYVNRAFIDR